MINMAAASLLSTNALDYCVILFVKKPFCATLLFRRGDSWRGLQWNMCWDTQASLHLEPPPRLILFLRVFRGCFYTAILSQTLCGYAFKTHISSSPNRRDSFIIWKRWHIFKRFLSLLRLELIASMFFLRCCSAIQWRLLRHKRFLSNSSYQHKTDIIKLIATGRER